MLRRMTIWRLLFVLAVIVWLPAISAGAQNTDQATPQATGKLLVEAKPSVMYIFRPRKFKASALNVDVSCDTEFVGQVNNGKYLTIKLPPGQNIIQISGK